MGSFCYTLDMDKFVTKDNYALLTDMYELTMAQAYLEAGKEKEEATFDLFVRKLEKRNYLVVAGIEDALSFILNVSFPKEYLSYLKAQGFSEQLIKYLKKLKFTGTVWAMPEGEIAFANEPIIRVTAPLIEAQILETYLINCVNLQTMLASKASRVVQAAEGRKVVDFGLRRCQGADAGMKAARSSYIAGATGTSNVLAGAVYNIPIYGTMAHSFIQSFENEEKAFEAFKKSFPNNTTLLVDTYDTIDGVKTATKIKKIQGIRLDSGNLLTLSKRAKQILNRHKMKDVSIFASGNLDEYKIEKLLKAKAPIDAFGVGTEMDTSSDRPSLDAVYKLVQVDNKPKMKFSKDKVTLPGIKQVYRQKNSDTIGLANEKIKGRPLLKQMIRQGKLITLFPSLDQIRNHAKKNVANLPKRLLNINKANKYLVKTSAGLKKEINKLS